MEDILKLEQKPKDIASLKETEEAIYLLEQWCFEKRKNFYYTESSKLPENKTSEDYQHDIIQLADELIEQAWIFGGIDSLRQLIDLIEMKKINGNDLRDNASFSVYENGVTKGNCSILKILWQFLLASRLNHTRINKVSTFFSHKVIFHRS